jgi:hypothetical protein
MRLGHDLVRNFEALPPDEAAVEIATHIRKFREPRMRQELLARIRWGDVTCTRCSCVRRRTSSTATSTTPRSRNPQEAEMGKKGKRKASGTGKGGGGAGRYLSPGVYLEEVGSGARPIEGVGTSTAAFIGFPEGRPRSTPDAAPRAHGRGARRPRGRRRPGRSRLAPGATLTRGVTRTGHRIGVDNLQPFGCMLVE